LGPKGCNLVNRPTLHLLAAWLAGVAILLAAAWLRGAEYDEQYTLFLTAGVARPLWPETPFSADLVQSLQTGQAGSAAILHDLRTTDVHPPVYFWIIAAWRNIFGGHLLTARLFSVLCGALSLAVVARIARLVQIAPAAAVAMTALCYGFAYTNAIARGFAPAELALLLGVALQLRNRDGSAGVFFGIACACNYLAVFPALAAGTAGRAWRAIPGALPFLALDAWCFAAQHASRTGQFPPFVWQESLQRLGEYQVAAVFGALPLYCDGIARIAMAAIVTIAAAMTALQLIRASCCAPTTRGILLCAGVAPACGLLALGALFNTTPIEFRYFAFGLPFLAILAAGPSQGRHLVMAVQAAGIAGLLLAPRTMQPARAAAAAIPPAHIGDLTLLPAGNDGVGIVGAFGIEAPATLQILLVRPERPITIPADTRRIFLVLLGQDDASRRVLPAMQQAVAGQNWRRVANSANLEVYERTKAGG